MQCYVCKIFSQAVAICRSRAFCSRGEAVVFYRSSWILIHEFAQLFSAAISTLSKSSAFCRTAVHSLISYGVTSLHFVGFFLSGHCFFPVTSCSLLNCTSPSRVEEVTLPSLTPSFPYLLLPPIPLAQKRWDVCWHSPWMLLACSPAAPSGHPGGRTSVCPMESVIMGGKGTLGRL